MNQPLLRSFCLPSLRGLPACGGGAPEHFVHFLMTIKNNLLDGNVLGARQLMLVPPGVVLRHEGFGERVVQVDGGELVLGVC